MLHVTPTNQLRQSAARKLSERQQRIIRGMYLSEDSAPDVRPDSLASRVSAALAVCPEGSLVSGLSALRLMDVQLPDGMPGDGTVTIAVPKSTGFHSCRPELQIQRLAVMPQRWRSNRPVAEPVHCWATAVLALAGANPWLPGRYPTPTAPGLFQHPRKVAFLRAVQLGDALIRRSQTVMRYEEFAARFSAWGVRHPGKRIVQEHFSWVRGKTDSYAETWMRLMVVDAGFPAPTVNYGVHGPNGWNYLDLSWPDRLIALEYHGRQHFDVPSQAKKDVYRRGNLQAFGWTIVESTRSDLDQPGDLLRRLDAAFGRADQRTDLG
ncbi:MAG: hypothetical protein LBJ62_07390 [Bifidobacteriaceae bacterium]|nr:hypothetical protein [Bifidobacteriaceae bacterium]